MLDIRVLLVGIEIWSVPQAATPASDATQLLDQFLQYAKTSIHKTAPVRYDFIALISYVYLDITVVVLYVGLLL